MRVDGDESAAMPMRRVGPRVYRTAYRSRRSISETTVWVEHPRVEARPERVVFLQHVAPPLPWSADFGDVQLRSRDSQAYGMLALRVRRALPVTPHDELVPVSDVFEVWPPEAILDGGVQLSMNLNAAVDSPGTLLIYRQTPKRWEALGRDDHEGQIGALTSQLGTFAVMNDQVEPKIRLFEPADLGAIASRRPEIRLGATDGGSGIDTFNATFGDRWLLMEYDPEQDLLTWERDEDLPAGEETLVVEVTDRAGNLARRQVTLRIPE
jgi:hypothetical protein